AEALVKCCKLPRKLNDASDAEILHFAKKANRVLLTYDRRIADEWPESFATGCPGVLIVAMDPGSVRRITESIAMNILRKFKDEYPAWRGIDCSNSVIELQPRYVYASHFEVDAVRRTGFVDRLVSGWQDDLLQLLRTNATRVY
ncbi:MAG: hypothetical protein ACREHD_22330, partial [Pirellulales bacterium]